jgi:hypothetical protein
VRWRLLLGLGTLLAVASGCGEEGARDGGAPRPAATGAPREGDPVTAPPRADPAPGSFVVLVRDEEGRPVVDARVSHPRSRARTDAEGRAVLGPTLWDLGSPRGDRHWKTLVVEAEGRPGVVLEGALARPGPIEVRLAARGAQGAQGR